MHLRAPLDRAGIDNLDKAARQWLEGRIARYGFEPRANNYGGLRCTLRHRHNDGRCAAAGTSRIIKPVPPSTGVKEVPGFPLAIFASAQLGADALVAAARRAAASGDIPADSLEGFRSTHPVASEVAGVGEDEREAAHVRAMLSDWHAFEQQGIRNDPRLAVAVEGWTRFRDAWLAGEGGDVTTASLLTDRVRDVSGLVYTDEQKRRVEWLNARMNDLELAYYKGFYNALMHETKQRWNDVYAAWKKWRDLVQGRLFGGPDDIDIERWESAYSYWLKNLEERGLDTPEGAKAIPNTIDTKTPPPKDAPTPTDTVKLVAMSAAAGAAILVVTTLALKLVNPL